MPGLTTEARVSVKRCVPGLTTEGPRFSRTMCTRSDHSEPVFQSDEVYLEAQIQNVTPAAICMETVSLEPSPLFDGENWALSVSGSI